MGVNGMDEPIVVETRMNYQDYKRFSWFIVLRKGKHIRPAILLMFAFVFIGLAAILATSAADSVEYLLETAGIYLLVLILFLPAYFLLLSFSMKRVYRQSGKMLEAPHRYEFSEEGMKAEAVGEGVSGTAEYRYDTLYRAFELRDSFYLNVSGSQAFLITKREMDGRTAERIAELLSRKLGKKYVKCF
jgi:hypothetical protein